MWKSTIPAAIDALVAGLKPVLQGVQVKDGPSIGSTAAPEVVAVGYTGGMGDSAVESTTAIEGLSLDPNREQYQILCAASVARGAGNIAAARIRVYELVAAVAAFLVADKTLSGTVMQAQMGDATLHQSQESNKGAVATVAFAVVVDAFTG